MKRKAFLLWLLGAVAAKAQDRASAGGNLMKQWLSEFKATKPRSGYFPLDGTKGEAAGVLLTADGLSDILNYLRAGGISEFSMATKIVLRCPHCGLLFTETKGSGERE